MSPDTESPVQNTNQSQDQNPVSELSAQPLVISPAVETIKPPKKRKGIIAAVVVIVLIGAAVLGVMMFGNDANNPQASRSVTSIDELRVGSLDGPIGADYVYPNPIGAGLSLSINLQIFEGLVGYEDQKISPLLAASWKNPDDSTWIFTLKPNVKFHNGKTLAATDVKNSLDSIIANEDWNYLFTTIDSVIVSSDKTVTIKTKAPDPLLLNRLVYGFIYSDNDDSTISGSGPYKFDLPKEPTETSASLIASSNYHLGSPKSKKLTFTVFDDTDALKQAMAENKIDIGKDLQNKHLAADLAKKNFSTLSSEDAGTYGLTLNLTKKDSPLANKQIREALAYAIDRQAFLKADDSSSVPSRYILPKSVVGFDQAARLPDVDVAKTKQILAQAGYTKEQPINYIYIAGIQTAAPHIIKQLNNAGFNIVATAFESPDEFVAAANDGKYDILGLSFTSDIGDGIDFFSSQLSSTSGQFPSIDDPKFDEMIGQAEQAFQANDHITKVQEINRYAAQNYLWIPLSQGISTYYYQKDLNLTIDSKVGASALYYWKIGKVQDESTTN